MSKYSDIMIADGFTKESRMWSFTPQMSETKGYWSKRVPHKGGYTDEIEIGVIVNEKYNTMEVYTCDCHIGCCGRSQGTHDFSIEKINDFIEKEKNFIHELNGVKPFPLDGGYPEPGIYRT